MNRQDNKRMRSAAVALNVPLFVVDKNEEKATSTPELSKYAGR